MAKKSEENYKKLTKNTIYIYFWITFVVCLLTCIGVFYNNSVEKIILYQKLIVGLYSIFTFIFLFFTNLEITSNPLVCGEKDITVSFMSTLIPFLFIYTLTMLIIVLFLPGWLRIFSNTIGLTISKLSGLENIVKILFIRNNEDENNLRIEKLYQDPYIYLNEVNLNTINIVSKKDENDDSNIIRFIPEQQEGSINFLPQFIKNKLFNKDTSIITENFIKLIKLLNLKDIIGYFIWMLLLGIITILLSFNYILTETCSIESSKSKSDWMNALESKLN